MNSTDTAATSALLAEMPEAPKAAIADAHEDDLVLRLKNLSARGHKLEKALRDAEERAAVAAFEAAGLDTEDGRRAARKDQASLIADVVRARSELEANWQAVEWATEHLGRYRSSRAAEQAATISAANRVALEAAATALIVEARKVDAAIAELAERKRALARAAMSWWDVLPAGADRGALAQVAGVSNFETVIGAALGHIGVVRGAAVGGDRTLPAPSIAARLLGNPEFASHMPASHEKEAA